MSSSSIVFQYESIKSNNQIQRLVFKPTEPNCRPELTIMDKITNYHTAHGKARPDEYLKSGCSCCATRTPSQKPSYIYRWMKTLLYPIQKHKYPTPPSAVIPTPHHHNKFAFLDPFWNDSSRFKDI